MKHSWISIILFLVLILSSCGQSIAPTQETSEPSKITAEETKEKAASIMQQGDPKSDDVINVLMIGNSGCYYYVEELYGVAKAAGINMKVCNLYYSGCPMEKHWIWWKQDE